MFRTLWWYPKPAERGKSPHCTRRNTWKHFYRESQIICQFLCSNGKMGQDNEWEWNAPSKYRGLRIVWVQHFCSIKHTKWGVVPANDDGPREAYWKTDIFGTFFYFIFWGSNSSYFALPKKGKVMAPMYFHQRNRRGAQQNLRFCPRCHSSTILFEC